MRKAGFARSHPPMVAGLGVTIASAAIAYVLLVVTCAMAVERLLDATPPDIVAGIAQSAASGWFPP